MHKTIYIVNSGVVSGVVSGQLHMTILTTQYEVAGDETEIHGSTTGVFIEVSVSTSGKKTD